MAKSPGAVKQHRAPSIIVIVRNSIPQKSWRPDHADYVHDRPNLLIAAERYENEPSSTTIPGCHLVRPEKQKLCQDVILQRWEPGTVLHNFKCLRTLVSLQVGENLSAKPSAPLGKRTRKAISRGCASWVSSAAQIARGITKLIAEMED
jgi:hypothetical protein